MSGRIYIYKTKDLIPTLRVTLFRVNPSAHKQINKRLYKQIMKYFKP